MLKRILFILLLISLELGSFFSPFTTKKANAAEPVNCTGWAKSVETDSTEIKDTDKGVRLRIELGNGSAGNIEKVFLYVKPPGGSSFIAVNPNIARSNPAEFTLNNNVLGNYINVLAGQNGNYIFLKETPNLSTFPTGNYSIAVLPITTTDVNEAYCVLDNFFTVNVTATGGNRYCALSLDPENNYTFLKNGDKPSIKIKALITDDSYDKSKRHHQIDLVRVTNNKATTIADSDQKSPTSVALESGWKIPNSFTWTPGFFQIKVYSETSGFERVRYTCLSDKFEIAKEEAGGGGICGASHPCDEISNSVNPNTPLSQPCKDSDLSGSGGCNRIKTGLGYVSTDTSNFTRWVLGFVLSFAGGIVILIIIIDGYRLMTSQGEPEKIKNARDQLTAAIVGLLFIIFSLALLELITRDILGLPGFGA